MRIWSLHPKYLDAKGLVALWRETLLAKHVLEGNTKGYKNHPQLKRFKESDRPLDAINFYLSEVYKEAVSRGYSFSVDKFSIIKKPLVITVTQGQVEYELKHLLSKLKAREPKLHKVLKRVVDIDVHPIFKVVNGAIESWEIIN